MRRMMARRRLAACGLRGGRAGVSVVLAVAVLIVLSGSMAQAATVVVQAGQQNGGTAPERQFNAASITIQAGDTVRWEWFDDEHDVTAYDGSWSSPLLNGPGQSFERTFPTAGTFTYYCDRHAGPSDARPDRIDQSIADGKMAGKIVVQASVDTAGPIASNVTASPNPTGGAASVTLTADISDAARGGSNVVAAEYFIDAVGGAGSGTSLAAADGSFNSPAEGVIASVATSGLAAGDHQLHVRGRDAAGNWGSVSATTLTIGAAASLSLSAQPVSFGNVNISGGDQLLAASAPPWRASDGRGSGDGWHVTLQSTDFSSALGTIPVGNLKVRVLQSSITTVSGNTAPSSIVTSYQPLITSPLKLISAAPGTGMGVYDFAPDFQLELPASAYAGLYTASLTTSINSGP